MDNFFGLSRCRALVEGAIGGWWDGSMDLVGGRRYWRAQAVQGQVRLSQYTS